MLTIVIPTKDEEAYLPRLLSSIKHQTVQPFEIIVADAQSTDRTREIARSFGAKVVEGGPVAIARNRGAAHATTDLMLFLDADVELLDPEFLEKSVKEMFERKFDLATCDVVPLSHARIDHFLHRAYNAYVHVCGSLFPHAPGFCMIVRKDLHDKLGGFDESVVFCEDHDYARRFRSVGRFGFLRSTQIPVSIRRLDRDGRWTIAVKYLLAEVHLAILGPVRHNYFHYTFGHKRPLQKS
ncbi:glycosyltransferase [Candidatus Uhrbacteria bacterium]|nr:glycosyltransferase [Candidatus Uhrbacteria bacterium]